MQNEKQRFLAKNHVERHTAYRKWGRRGKNGETAPRWFFETIEAIQTRFQMNRKEAGQVFHQMVLYGVDIEKAYEFYTIMREQKKDKC